MINRTHSDTWKETQGILVLFDEYVGESFSSGLFVSFFFLSLSPFSIRIMKSIFGSFFSSFLNCRHVFFFVAFSPLNYHIHLTCKHANLLIKHLAPHLKLSSSASSVYCLTRPRLPTFEHPHLSLLANELKQLIN